MDKRKFAITFNEIKKNSSIKDELMVQLDFFKQVRLNMNNAVENLQIHFSEQTTYHIDAFDLESLLEKVYGNRIEMTESSNDTTHKFNVEANNNEYKWDKADVEKAVQNGHLPCYQYYKILNDLCSKGHIKAGTYFIHMSW